MSGDSAAYTAMAQQQARLQQAQRDRLARRRDAAQNRDGDQTNAEALGCPQCKASYDFGTSCPGCDVFLVSASLVDLVAPEPVHPPVQWNKRLFDAAMISLMMLVIGGAWVFIVDGGLWLWW